MTLLALVAVAVALGLAWTTWIQRREAQERSAARVAALAAAIDGPLDAFSAETGLAASGLKTGGHVLVAMPARHGWIIAAGIVPLALVVAALLVTRGPRQAAPPQAVQQPQSLELLDMRHERAGDLFTVTGTVRVRGRNAAPVTATVTARDAAGRFVASGDAPLDDASLDLDGESSFRVSVSGALDVRRYQVRFETPLGPVTHVDRRPGRTAAIATP
jgi:hypothetical protein